MRRCMGVVYEWSSLHWKDAWVPMAFGLCDSDMKLMRLKLRCCLRHIVSPPLEHPARPSDRRGMAWCLGAVHHLSRKIDG